MYQPRELNQFEQFIEQNWLRPDGVSTTKQIVTIWIRRRACSKNIGEKELRHITHRAHERIDQYANGNSSPFAVADEMNEFIRQENLAA